MFVEAEEIIRENEILCLLLANEIDLMHRNFSKIPISKVFLVRK